MVDLHESLHPTGAVPPLPVSELAARVAVRRKRRRMATAGLVVGIVGGAAFAVNSIPGPQANTATVADGAETTLVEESGPTSTTIAPVDESDERTDIERDDVPSGPDESTADGKAPSTTSTGQASSSTKETGGTSGQNEEEVLSTTPGIRTETATTSSWEDGYCMQIDVFTDAETAVAWQVVMDLRGDVAELWNATATKAGRDLTVFSGESGYNTNVSAGAATSFGACVDLYSGEEP